MSILTRVDLGGRQGCSKTVDLAPSRTFYLWKVHLPAVKRLLQDQLCHAASNLRQRLEHELKQEEEVRKERNQLFFFFFCLFFLFCFFVGCAHLAGGNLAQRGCWRLEVLFCDV